MSKGSVEYKICSGCNTEHHIDNFDKKRWRCKGCISIYNRNVRIKNIEHLKKYQSTYYEDNKQEIIDNNKVYYEDNKENISIKKKIYNSKNKERIKLWNKEYREKNRAIRNIYEKNRKATDIVYKLTTDIRKLICSSIKRSGYKKASKTCNILGCSFEDFKKHIELQFDSWMNWNNHGNPKDGIYELDKTWDIDHITPLDTAVSYEEVIKLNHYTNLRPLCSYTNRWIKKNRVYETNASPSGVIVSSLRGGTPAPSLFV